MTASAFQSILYPTDFSDSSIPAFAHALRIAVGAKSELHAKTHSCDFIVMMTHARTGFARWMYGSIASETERRSRLPTLYLRRGSNGFVDRETGLVSLKRVLTPVDPAIPPLAARRLVEALALALQCPVEIRPLSVGRRVDLGGDWPPVDMRQGFIVDAIVGYAGEIDADLIVMPTAGRRGLFDALSGSTTERVLIGADRPVLAVPTAET